MTNLIPVQQIPIPGSQQISSKIPTNLDPKQINTSQIGNKLSEGRSYGAPAPQQASAIRPGENNPYRGTDTNQPNVSKGADFERKMNEQSQFGGGVNVSQGRGQENPYAPSQLNTNKGQNYQSGYYNDRPNAAGASDIHKEGQSGAKVGEVHPPYSSQFDRKPNEEPISYHSSNVHQPNDFRSTESKMINPNQQNSRINANETSGSKLYGQPNAQV